MGLVWGGSRELLGSAATAWWSVALDGDNALLGSALNGAGTASIFTRTESEWLESQVLAPSGEPSQFGRSVALSDDVALVAAGSEAASPGALHSFVRTDATWSEEAVLQAPVPEPTDGFGVVALSGAWAVVGASGTSSSRGAAYLYERVDGSWTSGPTLLASDGAELDEFGHAVAIAGDTVVVGAPRQEVAGAAYVFVRSGSSWTEQQKLVPSNPDTTADDAFGSAVAIDGDRMLIGAGDSGLGRGIEYAFAGSFYAFSRSGTTWTEVAHVIASDGLAYDEFGGAIALDGERALIGARGDDAYRGAVYAYRFTGTEWLAEQKLTGETRAEFDYFGTALALEGSHALVGAQIYPRAYYLGSANGAPCSDPSACASATCVDGRCCDRPCAGACAACSVAEGADVDGICKIFDAGAPGLPACGALVCNGLDLVCSGCTSDDRCAELHYCAQDATCQPRKALGEACSEGAPAGCTADACSACSSGHCRDGVCCDSACEGVCEACSAALTGASDGECAPIPADEDPGGECAADLGYPASCRADGFCDGLRRCRPHAKRGTACGPTTCLDAEISGTICEGSGSCEDGAEASCGAYRCSGDACGSSCSGDSDCADSAYCERDVCKAKQALGESCAAGRECQSEHCADGVCCNGPCDGQCEACGEEGTEGTCTPVLGEPRGGRPPCARDDTTEVCTQTLCDGEQGDRCRAYVGADTACRPGSCEDGLAVLPASCDGRARCEALQSMRCEPFACAGSTCGRSPCGRDSECAPRFRCASGDCVPADVSCSEDASSLVGTDGSSTTCLPFRCADGACLERCESAADCAPGNRCSADGDCVAGSAPASTSESGCGCRFPARDQGGAWRAVLLGLALMRVRRRTRRLLPWAG